jgi:hypothetical protein
VNEENLMKNRGNNWKKLIGLLLVAIYIVKISSFSVSAAETAEIALNFGQSGQNITVSYNQISDSTEYALLVKEGNGEFVQKTVSDVDHMNFTASYGILYTVKVVSRNEGGEVLGESGDYQVCLPKAVTNIKTAGQSKTSVKLSWTGADYATSYVIYRKLSGGSYSKVGETKETSYLDSKITYGKAYTYKIVSCSNNGTDTFEGEEAAIDYSNQKIVSTSHKKYSYSEMSGDIKQLAAKYNGMVTYDVIGKSLDNRNIYDVILGNPKAKKTLIVVSTMHAREYMATLVTMSQIEYYLESYNSKISGKKVSTTLNNVCIHFVPMANPDGVTISQSGISKINNASLRKTLKKLTKGKGTSTWKANARGVDLNRNWGYKWKKMGKASASGYSGKSVNSEPETKALVSLKKKLKNNGTLKATISYHTMGNIVFGKCTKKSIKSTTTKMYKLAKSITGYQCGDTTYGGSGIGNSREWDMYKLGVPSITLEVGSKAAPGPISQFKGIWSKNKNVVIREAMLFD